VFSLQVLQGLDWPNGRTVQLYSAAPTPGRATGAELLQRFGD
jgi:hypothetical protein